MSRIQHGEFNMVMFGENGSILDEFQKAIGPEKSIEDELRKLIRFQIVGARLRERKRISELGKTEYSKAA